MPQTLEPPEVELYEGDESAPHEVDVASTMEAPSLEDNAPPAPPAPVEPEQTPSDPTSDIPQNLIDEAVERGYTADEAAAFGSSTALRKAILAHDRTMSRLGRAATTAIRSQPVPVPQTVITSASELAKAPAPQPPAAPVAPSVPTQTPVAPPVNGRFQIPWREEEVDPEIVKAVRGLHEFYGSKIEALEQRLSARDEADQYRTQDIIRDQFDAALTRLPEDYRALLGDGSRHDLDESSEEMKLRQAIFDEFLNAQFPAYVKVSGEDPRKLPKKASDKLFGDLVKRAANVILAEKLPNQTLKTVRSKLTDRQSDISVPPSASAGRRRLSPTQRAIEAVAAKMGEMRKSDEVDPDEIGLD